MYIIIIIISYLSIIIIIIIIITIIISYYLLHHRQELGCLVEFLYKRALYEISVIITINRCSIEIKVRCNGLTIMCTESFDK